MNHSAGDNRQTWTLAENLYWRGEEHVHFTNENNAFAGVVMEMEFRDSQKQEQTQIHLKEIKRKHNLETKEELIRRTADIADKAEPPSVKYPPK